MSAPRYSADGGDHARAVPAGTDMPRQHPMDEAMDYASDGTGDCAADCVPGASADADGE